MNAVHSPNVMTAVFPDLSMFHENELNMRKKPRMLVMGTMRNDQSIAGMVQMARQRALATRVRENV